MEQAPEGHLTIHLFRDGVVINKSEAYEALSREFTGMLHRDTHIHTWPAVTTSMRERVSRIWSRT